MSDTYKIQELQQKLGEQQEIIQNLMGRIEAAENYSRQDCLILRVRAGQVQPNMGMRSEVRRLLEHHTGVTFEPWCINTAHWLKMGESIVIRFNNKAVREEIYRNRVPRDSSRRGLIIHELLSKPKSELVARCAKLRRLGKISTYYTQGGNVFVRYQRHTPVMMVDPRMTNEDIMRRLERQPSSYASAVRHSAEPAVVSGAVTAGGSKAVARGDSGAVVNSASSAVLTGGSGGAATDSADAVVDSATGAVANSTLGAVAGGASSAAANGGSVGGTGDLNVKTGGSGAMVNRALSGGLAGGPAAVHVGGPAASVGGPAAVPVESPAAVTVGGLADAGPVGGPAAVPTGSPAAVPVAGPVAVLDGVTAAVSAGGSRDGQTGYPVVGSHNVPQSGRKYPACSDTDDDRFTSPTAKSAKSVSTPSPKSARKEKRSLRRKNKL